MTHPISQTSTAVGSLSQLALQIAISQLGISEKPVGSNAGPEVNQYLASVGLSPGYAWCQAFVHWCYDEAANKISQSNPVIRTGGVLDCWNRTAVQHKITKGEALQHAALLIEPGCQFVLSFHEGAHTGIVEKVEGLVVHTIEGNSNENGSREGYEVVRHKRSIGSPYLIGFICY